MAEHKCSEADCSETAERYCFTCVEYFCAEHECEHLVNSVQLGTSWLSTPAVVERMSDQELADTRLRLVTQLYAIDRELFDRKFDTYRRTGGSRNLQIGDLVEFRTKGRGGRRPPGQRPPKKASISETTTAQTLSAALKGLKPETMKKVQEAFMKKFGGGK
jgi:hypothetical protein